MIVWCSYCQRFMGERHPYSSFQVTHGICRACAKHGLRLPDEEVARLRTLAEIQMSLDRAGRSGASDEEAVRLVEKASQAGIAGIEILVGFVSPLLAEIGRQWQAGEITVAQEHRFTRFCERVLALVATKVPEPSDHGLDFLVLSAPDNYHTLGSRVLSLWMNDRGLRSKALYPGIPPEEAAKVVDEYRPARLGISISMVDQIPGVRAMIETVRAVHPPEKLAIVLGGAAVKENLVPEIAGTRILSEPTLLFEETADRRTA
jgi:methanogenic corrinoid protein MtbC1